MGTTHNVRSGDVAVLVGTRKGGFILSSDQSRREWSLAGPFNDHGDVFHMVYDSRNGGTVVSAVNSMFWGANIQLSHDWGSTWLDAERNPRMSDGSDRTLDRLWHVEPGRENEPGVMYAGGAPTSLFRSMDWGNSWEQWSTLTLHPTRDRWEPGLGGLCLHSMVLDPRSTARMWVGISAVGVMTTEDAGESWDPVNTGVRADFLPDPFPEYGQCTHKLLSPTSMPDRLYQQNHCGFFRSDNGGEEWLDLSDGLPSRFGFVLGLHPDDPDTIYILPEDTTDDEEKPLAGDARYVSHAKMRVFRSRNAGEDWEPLTNGLPQQNAYLHVMREGMATDTLDPCGIYIGTSAGQIFYSRNNGDTWELMIDYLPPINSIEVAIAK